MLERYFIRPDTVDRIRASWIGSAIEQYVTWMSEHDYAARNVYRRVPVLVQFGEFARAHGASTLESLPAHVEAFVEHWGNAHSRGCKTHEARKKVWHDARNPVQQMLHLLQPDFVGAHRHKDEWPFLLQAPGFLTYLREERGLRPQTLYQYQHHLSRLAAYLGTIGLVDLRELCPAVFGAFIADSATRLSASSMSTRCGVLRVFLRYLFRELVLDRDLSVCVERSRAYRLQSLPRSITWEEVGRMLSAVDRRTAVGKRDYVILLLLVTYGLRAREVAALTLDDVDWKRERLRIPERKAGHSSAYPLSATVGTALLDYLQNGRPKTKDRAIFFRVLAPRLPLTQNAVSSRAAYYLHRAGISVLRPGSHTLRHTCVQRLVDGDFPFKVIGDYVGHGSSESTEIYTKVAVETLRQVALGDGEDVL